MQNKLKLYGFNNLTKALSFNIYDVCYAKTEREQRDYIKYIDQQYNSERLTGILERVTEMIGAHVLHISKQDYDPQGASVTFLIAEEHMKPALEPDTIVAHLDKSHVTVHTYPEYHPDTCLATFRVDIDVATCGEITPLSTLDYLIGSFDSDIITMDYRVRGFTRDIEGKKLFMDHHMTSIQDLSIRKRSSGTTPTTLTCTSPICSTPVCCSRRSICRTTCSTPTSMSCRPRPDSRFTPTSDER